MRRIQWIGLSMLLLLAAVPLSALGQSEPTVDPEAEALIRAWCERAAGQQSFRFEVLDSIGAVVCQLPPGAWTENIGGLVHYVFDGIYYQAVYDGDQVCYEVVVAP